MGEGWKDIPVRRTAKEWEGLSQQEQALLSGRESRPEGMEYARYGGPDFELGGYDVPEGWKTPDYYNAMLDEITGVGRIGRNLLDVGKNVDLPTLTEGGDVGAQYREGIAKLTPTVDFMKRMLTRQRGSEGAIYQDPSLWGAVEEYIQTKDASGLAERANRMPTFKANLMTELRKLKELEDETRVATPPEAVRRAVRVALSNSWQTIEGGRAVLKGKKTGTAKFFSTERMFSEAGRKRVLRQEVGKGDLVFSPAPKYGPEFQHHAVQRIFRVGPGYDGMAKYHGEVAYRKGGDSPQMKHVNFLIDFRYRTYEAMGTRTLDDGQVRSVIEVMEAYDSGQIKKPWEALGYKNRDEFEKDAGKTGADIFADTIDEQVEEGLRHSGNFDTEAGLVDTAIMQATRKIREDRLLDLNNALHQESESWRRLQAALGGSFDGMGSLEELAGMVLDANGEANNGRSRTAIMRKALGGQKGKLATDLDIKMAERVREMLIEETMTVDEAVGIWKRNISGQTKLNNKTVNVFEEMSKYTMPIAGQKALRFAITLAYRAAVENPAVFQMFVRDYDERNPEDNARQATFMHKLTMAAREALVTYVKRYGKTTGAALPGGKVEESLDWDQLPGALLSLWKTDRPGYANMLMRHFFEEDYDDVMVGKFGQFVPLPLILPQYDPRR